MTKKLHWSIAIAGGLILGDGGSILAHQQKLAIGGRAVTLKTNTGAAKAKFAFRAVRQTVISSIAHNPALEGAAVMVHGTGPNAGKTGLIPLHPAYWRPSANGWVYNDPASSRGGIRRLVLRTGNSGATLKILARGSNWPWLPTGPLDELWVRFKLQNEWYCAKFGGEIRRNETGLFKARNALPDAACPDICGNGEVEAGEECDDGNLIDTDGCTASCTVSACAGEEFDSTWDALQAKIIGESGCTAAGFCHAGAFPAGNLNLEPANAYANLVNTPSLQSTFDRVEPGDQDLSFLYLKLAAATLPSQYPPGSVPGSPMPAGGQPPISAERLEALRLWIRAGAPETGTVAGTAELLEGCLPPASPNKIPPLDPPAFGEGVQIYAPPWDLPAQSEDEVCYSIYYDFSLTPGMVPASVQTPCPSWLGGPSQTCFRYHSTTLAQDPQSHHSIIHIYRGAYDTTNSGWGPWTCRGGPNHGTPCNPLGIGTPAPAGADCGDPRSACAGSVQSTVACVGYGPPDYGFNNNVAPSFGGAQEALSSLEYADGVYNVLPLNGIVVINSHAFNLTDFDTTMEQYYNLYFAAAPDQQYQVQGVFDSSEIFVQNVPPFSKREYCRTFTFTQNSHVFHFSSHTHRFGKLFRIFAPPNAPCTAGGGCLPNAGAPIYVSTQYNDPVQLIFDPPIILSSGDPNQRTYKFCAEYDNGFTSASEVKRYSTSPEPPIPAAPGGPCAIAETRCLGGYNQNYLCGGNDVICTGGVCDACPLRGGVTTEDEMFILLGSYYVP